MTIESLETTQQGDAASRHARAMRLKRLRKLTGHSRKSFSEKHGLSQGTLQNWETARFGGLTEKGARALIDAFREEGVIVYFEWLMYGAGQSPDILQGPNTRGKTAPARRNQPTDPMALAKELEHFYSLHADAVHMIMPDDTMEPFFEASDTLAGCRVTDISEQAVGRYCIVETFEHKVLCRYIKNGSQPDLYHLLSVNPYSSQPQPILYNVRIRVAAPVIWVRKKDS